MEGRVKLVLEALKDAREVLDLGGARHVLGTDKAMALVARVDQAIAALSGPEELSSGAEGVVAQIAAVLYDHKFGNEIGFLGKTECDELAKSLAHPLSASRQVVPREAIGYVLSEGQVPVDVYITADAFEILIDAIFSLQLPAPQPVAGIEQAIEILRFIADRHDTPIVQKDAARRGLAALKGGS